MPKKRLRMESLTKLYYGSKIAEENKLKVPLWVETNFNLLSWVSLIYLGQSFMLNLLK